MHWLFDISANGTASMATFLTNVKHNWFLFRIYKKEYVSVNLLYFLQMRKAECPKKSNGDENVKNRTRMTCSKKSLMYK